VISPQRKEIDPKYQTAAEKKELVAA